MAYRIGVDIGGTNPAFWAVANSEALGYAQYDSWLTVGITEGAPANASARPYPTVMLPPFRRVCPWLKGRK